MPKIRLPKIKALENVIEERFINPSIVKSQGGLVFGTPIINNGCEFDGSTDYIRYPKIRFNNTRQFSFNARLREVNDYVSKTIFASDVATGPLLWFVSSTGINFFPNQSDTPVSWTGLTLTAPNLNVGLTFDADAQEAELFINGVSQGTRSTVVLNDTAGVLEIGSRLGATSVLDGIIDEFSFHTKILDATDFLSFVDDSGLVLRPLEHFPLHDKVGVTAPFLSTDVIKGSGMQLGDGVAAATFPDKLDGKNGYSFDGNQYGLLDGSPLNDYSATEISVSVWFNVQQDDFDGVFVTLLDSAQGSTSINGGFFIILDDRGSGNPTNGFSMSLRASAARTYKSPDNVIQNGLNHLVMTYDSSNDLRAYLNGEEVAGTLSGGGSGDFVPSSTDDVTIGATANTLNNKFIGEILDFQFYTEALNPVKVAQLYHLGYKYLGNK